MAFLTRPKVADRSPWENVTSIQSTALVAQLTTSATNAATSATQVAGLTATTTQVNSKTQYFEVFLSGDSVSNSGSNNVVITLWVGTVGTGTQVGSFSATAQSGALVPLAATFFVPVSATSALVPGSSYVLNIGMHGSGAGTNTMTAGATSPVTMVVQAI